MDDELKINGISIIKRPKCFTIHDPFLGCIDISLDNTQEVIDFMKHHLDVANFKSK